MKQIYPTVKSLRYTKIHFDWNVQYLWFCCKLYKVTPKKTEGWVKNFLLNASIQLRLQQQLCKQLPGLSCPEGVLPKYFPPCIYLLTVPTIITNLPSPDCRFGSCFMQKVVELGILVWFHLFLNGKFYLFIFKQLAAQAWANSSRRINAVGVYKYRPGLFWWWYKWYDI